MIRDSIVAEVRTAREAILKRFDYDVLAMMRDARQRERLLGKRVVSFAHPPFPAQEKRLTRTG